MMDAGAVMGDLLRDVSGPAAGSLVAAIWQGALLAGAAALGLKLLPKTPAAARFAIWFSVFLMVAGLPFVSLWAHSAGSHQVLNGHSVWFTIDGRWSEAALLLWLAASVVRGTTLLAGAVRVHALWRRATPIQTLEGMSGSKAGRRVEICTSDEIDRPSVIGFFAPKILIPSWLVEKLTPEEMEHVILHEAGHLRRADDWLNLLQKLALVVFPLNPALAWVERRLCFERELACDERVLEVTGAPKAYASCLASLAEHRLTRRGMALVMGAVGRESELGQRVRRILSGADKMRLAHTRLVMGGAVLALVAGAAGLERCPQLVGFASGQAHSGQAQMIGGASLLPAAGYQNVVYRQSGASGMPRVIDTVVRTPVNPATPAGVGKHLARPARTLARVVKTVAPAEAPKLPKQRFEQRVSAAAEQPTVVRAQWVVLTSWTSETPGYSTRMVMTSVETRPALEPAGGSATRAGADEPGAGFPAVQPEMRVIFPYAAVPVRGGWLVIQL